MTAPYPPIKPNPIWFIFALGLVVAELVYLALLYPSLPQQLPVRFDLLGQATGWAEKRAWLVFGPTLLLPALLALVWFSGVAMGRMASKDALTQVHDAFSAHAGKQKPRQLAAAQALGARCPGLLCPPPLCPDPGSGALLWWAGPGPDGNYQAY
ncbi:DUF1648 domain-containing protein [Rothia nasimurium]|uniref:DUF1648 domain-containing protein n=1 Tax=Rothia nasimurium TaxID=85336 RepID=UPI002DD63A92|nr:DUF1648 domain-containing protein [Rothia nasimurium]